MQLKTSNIVLRSGGGKRVHYSGLISKKSHKGMFFIGSQTVLSRIVALTAELGEVFADCFNVPEGNGQHGDVMDDWFELF
jgi:hypothetical protein